MRRLLLLLQDSRACGPGRTSFDSEPSQQFLSESQAVSPNCALTMLAVAFPRNIDTLDLSAMHVERAITCYRMRNDSIDEVTGQGTSETSRKP
jgi:hypothetical protein